MSQILQNINVLDLTQGAAGPISGMFLGDLGADVIKVEPPSGEWGRTLGPPFACGESAVYMSLNRNKRDIVINLKQPDGIKILQKMIRKADVLLESYRPGVMKRLGLGYEEVSKVNPRIVYCSISGFGQRGPLRDHPGVDGIIQGYGGLMSVTGNENGPPVKAGTVVADMAGGMTAAQSVLAALYYRERINVGQHVEVALIDALMTLQSCSLGMYLVSGELPKRFGSAAPYAVPNGAFPTSDGYIMVAAYAEKRWRKLCEIIGRPDLVTDPRFCTNNNRVENRSKIIPILEQCFQQKTTKEWQAILEEGDIICGPINTYEDLVNDPQIKENKMILEIPHPLLGCLPLVGIAPKFSVSPGLVKSPPPLLGEHTIQILSEYGYSRENIAMLMAKGVVSQHSFEKEVVATANM